MPTVVAKCFGPTSNALEGYYHPFHPTLMQAKCIGRQWAPSSANRSFKVSLTAYPAFLLIDGGRGWRGPPTSICKRVNDRIRHLLPHLAPLPACRMKFEKMPGHWQKNWSGWQRLPICLAVRGQQIILLAVKYIHSISILAARRLLKTGRLDWAGCSTSSQSSRQRQIRSLTICRDARNEQ
jgi:hypothetical protein